MDANGKTSFAIVVSHSLLDFREKLGLSERGSRNGVNCVQNGQELLPRASSLPPYLRCQLRSSTAAKASNDVRLLLHGITLMGVFNQTPQPFAIYSLNTDSVESLRAEARQQFRSVNWGVSEGFRQAVEACLRGVCDIRGNAWGQSEETFSTFVYTRVIGPLTRDFASLRSDKESDQALSQLQIPSISYKSLQPPPVKSKPAHLKSLRAALPAQFGPPTISSFTYAGAIPTDARAGPPQLEFFDVDDNPEPKQIQGAARWVDRFDRARQAEVSRKRGSLVMGKGVKVVVLDTGVDLHNPWIASQGTRIQCWPSAGACKDTDGHGTQVAYLLLRLAPLVQVRVAKVSKSYLLQDIDVEAIAKAIRHFSSDAGGGERVDMINLSFGFPRFHERLRPIHSAILDARKNNVLVFAAAGNEGGNQGVSWPAKLLDVIGVHAADSYGNPASFSPADGGLGHHRLCTLGEAVPSCETRMSGGGNGVVHRSGTSFATPIAVATAAIVLGFMDAVACGALGVAPEDPRRVRLALRTRSGMESALRRACVLQGAGDGNAGYSYITPWSFLEMEEMSRVGIIANELRNCPE